MENLEAERIEGLADIDYYLHELEESGIEDSRLIAKMMNGRKAIKNAKDVQTISDHLSMLWNLFEKASK